MTATSQPQTTVASEDAGFALPPSPSPEEGRRSRLTRRREVVLVIIAILAVLLVGATLETGILGPGAGNTAAINSPTTPLTGQQLLAAYTTNQTQAEASYTNKTVYIQDNLDFGVGRDFSTGQLYSSVNSGTVILIWNATSQVDQLFAGAHVLAKCSVEGVQVAQGVGYLVYLQGCDLISVQAPTSTNSTASVYFANV
jgi:hypothetical protein